MGQLFKHMAVRLWTALLIGSLTALIVLPALTGMLGSGWMVIPGLGLVVAAFWLTGTVFAAMGRRRLERLIGEASVWERAGMAREARQALARAEATVDSFFFSPLSRREPAGRLLSQIARLQLAQTTAETLSDPIVEAYLLHFPREREAAIKWLNGVLAGRAVSRKSHDIAARIGAAHPEDAAIQRMIAQFYVAERRCDFAALQTYRQAMDAAEPLADDLLGGMAELFIVQQRADSLALEVYLAALDRGHRDRRLLAGIAACSHMVHPSPLTLPLLKKAAAFLNGIDAPQRRKMALTFLPEVVSGGPPQPSGWRRIKLPVTGPMLRKSLSAMYGTVRTGASRIAGQWRKIKGRLSSRQGKAAVKWVALGLAVIAVGWLVVNTAMHLAADFKTVEKTQPPPVVVVPVTDPFTLQVAAYVKEADARRFADQLKGQGLDAYWTRATGGNKIWYQVRISHFKTKAEARSMGEDLKNRQLIGDYYVANYRR